MDWSAEAQSAIASGFDSDASTQSIANTLSSSSRPASPIATFQITVPHLDTHSTNMSPSTP
jgi:hypothetical protein